MFFMNLNIKIIFYIWKESEKATYNTKEIRQIDELHI